MIILGNLFSLISNLLAFTSTRVKSYKMMLLLQVVDSSFNALANVALGGYSGALISICGIVRNLYCALCKQTKIISYIIVIITVMLGIKFTFHTWYDILPILASAIYSIIILNTKEVLKSKIGLIINCSLWVIYGFIIYNFVAVIFRSILIISCMLNIRDIKKDKEKIGE